MATEQQRAFARNIYAAALQATDIAPEFVTAQAILESGWGKSRVGRFNLFGITKGSNWNLGSGLSLIMMIFILISMAFIAKYDKDGEGMSV